MAARTTVFLWQLFDMKNIENFSSVTSLWRIYQTTKPPGPPDHQTTRPPDHPDHQTTKPPGQPNHPDHQTTQTTKTTQTSSAAERSQSKPLCRPSRLTKAHYILCMCYCLYWVDNHTLHDRGVGREGWVMLNAYTCHIMHLHHNTKIMLPYNVYISFVFFLVWL